MQPFIPGHACTIARGVCWWYYYMYSCIIMYSCIVYIATQYPKNQGSYLGESARNIKKG